MAERTNYDDTIDKAIELLIADDTEGFVLTTIEEDDLHLVKATNNLDEDLLSIYIQIEELRMMASEAGGKLSALDILAAVADAARETGMLDAGVLEYERM